MTEVKAALQNSHELDPLGIRDETSASDCGLTAGARGPRRGGGGGGRGGGDGGGTVDLVGAMAHAEKRIEVAPPDLLHEDGQGSGDPDVHHGEDLEEGIEIGRTCERMISEGSRGRKG